MQTTRTPTKSPQPPSPRALQRAHAASRRARNTAQLRLKFIARDAADAPPPPLVQMLRGGQGGKVRLKLMISFLWFQTDGTRAVPLSYPAQVWAELLDLPDPQTAGARRINEAQRWLETHNFITVNAQPGHANQVTVLNETGNGQPYTPPGRAANMLRGKEEQSEHLYTQIPATLWTNGYMASLSGAGLAFFLVLLDQYGPGAIFDPDPVWFSPKVLKERYALSDDTRAKGMKELQQLRLITVRRQPINPDDFDLERIRNTYTLDPDALEHPVDLDKTSRRRATAIASPEVTARIVKLRTEGLTINEIIHTLRLDEILPPQGRAAWNRLLVRQVLQAANKGQESSSR